LDGSARNASQRNLYSAAGPVPDYTKYPIINGTIPGVGVAPSHIWNANAGYFARINYSYDNRYLLELAARYDGSSAYPVADRWAFFPSISAGWNITNEKFAQGLKKVVNNWKLRASYGSMGNPIPSFYLPLMPSGTTNWIMSTGQLAQYVGLPANIPPTLTWEHVSKFDIGTDASFLKGDLDVTFDWFQNLTTGMISQGVTVPQTFGTGAANQNNGTERTRGFELGLNYQHQFANGLKVYGNANLFNFISVITQIGGNPANSLSQQWYTGETVGEIWGFKTVGFFQDAADVTNSPSQKGLQSGTFAFGPGDIKYADLDHNDTIGVGALTASNHGDLTKIGNSAPRYQYSFRLGASWKGFDIDAYFQGVGAHQYWATGAIAIPNYGGNGELLGNQMDFSTLNTGTNQDVLNPTTVNNKAWWPNLFFGNGTSNFAGETFWDKSAGASGNNFYPQTKYLLNLAYLRLKTLTVGYTLPAKLTRKADIQSLRFYVQGMNILTFKHNNHVPIDPEVTSGSYYSNAYYGENSPINKTYSFGVQVTF
ncbi:MAG: TonB-dependent receptor, partial [Chitinophagaceae bacterium]|nr:TonB-dependent receptor [Chitinophagaceae bacterium]